MAVSPLAPGARGSGCDTRGNVQAIGENIDLSRVPVLIEIRENSDRVFGGGGDRRGLLSSGEGIGDILVGLIEIWDRRTGTVIDGSGPGVLLGTGHPQPTLRVEIEIDRLLDFRLGGHELNLEARRQMKLLLFLRRSLRRSIRIIAARIIGPARFEIERNEREEKDKEGRAHGRGGHRRSHGRESAATRGTSGEAGASSFVDHSSFEILYFRVARYSTRSRSSDLERKSDIFGHGRGRAVALRDLRPARSRPWFALFVHRFDLQIRVGILASGPATTLPSFSVSTTVSKPSAICVGIDDRLEDVVAILVRGDVREVGPTWLSPISHLWQRRHWVSAFSRKIFGRARALPPARATRYLASGSSSAGRPRIARACR